MQNVDIMKIGWIELPKGKSLQKGGGSAYRASLFSLLSKEYDVEPMGLAFNKKHKLYSGIKTFYELVKLKGNKDVWMRDYLSTLTLPFDNTVGHNLLVVHHIDSNYLAYPALSKALDKMFYHSLKKIDTLVVGSNYWKNHFENLGYDVKLIYNCFDVSDFEFTSAEIIDFKKRYNLSEKPIIYLGNCQKPKGVVEAYNELKDLDVYLVTSGEKGVDIPAVNLNLSYRDYLLLLKASSVVVTMSKMKEGWCRTAHEAMLCKTPVVGSGQGGMAELLDGGGQILCEDFSKLRNNVEHLLNHPEIGENGYRYGSQKKFSKEFFERKWIKLIDDIKYLR